MNWNMKKLFILFVLNICLFYVHCQNEESFHNFDLVKAIKKSAEDINLSENLKQLSDEDKYFINAFQDFLSKSIPPKLLELLTGVTSDKCLQDLQSVLWGFVPPKEWALKMLDSFGKPESGILLGNLKWLGSYDECLKVYAPPKGGGIGDFHGKYCTLNIPLAVGGKTIPILTAVCLPDSCSPNSTFDGMFKNIPPIFNSTGMNDLVESIFFNATIACQARTKEITAGFIFVVSLFSIIALLAVIGSFITALEYFLKAKAENKSENGGDKLSLEVNMENGSTGSSLQLQSKEVALPAWLERYKPFFNCFCIFTNGEKLLNTDGAEGQLPCLFGIRFLSITWVIICHTYMGAVSVAKNPLDTLGLVDHWIFQVVMNGFFSVDSFFVLSGFLVGYLYFKQAAKLDGKFPWLLFYVHRYIRLTPVFMLVLAFHATISPYLGSGPLWPDGNVDQGCKNSWWWNLLYINNFKSQSDNCMGWSWYLANDMQFYVISPLFLITLYKWPKIGYSIIGLFFCITFSANFAITYTYNLVAGMGNLVEYASDFETFMPKLTEFMNKIYVKPYTRIGAYLVGLILGHIVYKWKKNNSGKLNSIHLGIGWALAAGIALTCQFGLYHQKLSPVATSFYNALSHIGFSLGLAWVIFVCVIGQGGVVNSLLSWKPIIPLSRLTYCAYLVHPIVENPYFTSIRMLIEFTHIRAIILCIGAIVLSYAVALVTSLLFESPVIRLEKLLRSKKSS